MPTLVEQTRRQRDTLVELEGEVRRRQLERGGSGGVLLELLHDDGAGERSPLSRLAREEAGEKGQGTRSGAERFSVDSTSNLLGSIRGDP